MNQPNQNLKCDKFEYFKRVLWWWNSKCSWWEVYCEKRKWIARAQLTSLSLLFWFSLTWNRGRRFNSQHQPLDNQSQVQLERKALIEFNQIRFDEKSDDASLLFSSPFLSHGRLCLRSWSYDRGLFAGQLLIKLLIVAIQLDWNLIFWLIFQLNGCVEPNISEANSASVEIKLTPELWKFLSQNTKKWKIRLGWNRSDIK